MFCDFQELHLSVHWVNVQHFFGALFGEMATIIGYKRSCICKKTMFPCVKVIFSRWEGKKNTKIWFLCLSFEPGAVRLSGLAILECQIKLKLETKGSFGNWTGQAFQWAIMSQIWRSGRKLNISQNLALRTPFKHWMFDTGAAHLTNCYFFTVSSRIYLSLMGFW